MKTIISLFFILVFILPVNADTRYSLSVDYYPDQYGKIHHYPHHRPYREFRHRHRPYFKIPGVIYLPRETVIIEKEPEIYIEKEIIENPSATEDTTSSETNANNYWYYCRDPEGYYPQVSRCPTGWMQVVPHKPPQ